MKARDMRIGMRLAASYGVFICIILLLCIMGFKNERDVSTAANEITNIAFEKAMLVNSILIDLQTINKEMGKAVRTNDKAPLKTVGEMRAKYLASLDKLEKLETWKEGKEIIGKLKAAVAEAREANVKVAKMVEDANWADAAPLYDRIVEPAFDTFMRIGDDLVKFQQKGIQEHYRQIVRDSRHMKIMLALLGVGALALAVMVSVLVTRTITVPIGKNVEIARTLAEGNLTVRTDVDRKDEFGAEIEAFKTMVDRWKALITEVKASAAQVASASDQLGAFAEILSSGASAQAERTVQVSTASEEMSQAALDIARHANGMADSAKAMVDTADNGSAIVNKSVDEVKQIAETVEKSSQFVKDLGRQSEKIGEIVLVINDIADQTNLLALNAAIEAARAGDAGRGFAVVADEVKKLAERTAKSTQEIAGMIGAIKTGVGKAVASMDEASRSVKTGVDLSNEAGAALLDIVTSSSSLQSMIQQIAAATEEMNSTTVEIARDIEQVASVTKDSSSAAEQVTNAAAELSALSANLQHATREFKV